MSTALAEQQRREVVQVDLQDGEVMPAADVDVPDVRHLHQVVWVEIDFTPAFVTTPGR